MDDNDDSIDTFNLDDSRGPGAGAAAANLPQHKNFDDEEDLSQLDRGDNLDLGSIMPADAPAPAPAAPAPAPAAAPTDGTQGDGGNIPAMIPRSRLNEEIERRRRLEEEVEALRRSAAAAPAPAAPAPAPAPAEPAVLTEEQIQSKEREYLDLVMEGKTDDAMKIRTEINQAIEARATINATTTIAKTSQAQALRAMAAQVSNDYPFLDEPEHEETLDLIIQRRNAYQAAGMPAAEALRKAADLIAPRFAPADYKPRAAAPAPAPNPGAGKQGANVPGDTRQANAVNRNVNAANAQPPALRAGVGNGADEVKLNPETMTEEQFDALPEAKKAELRGDAV